MSTRPPPVPPANRARKGTGADPEQGVSDLPEKRERENFDTQGRSANTKQNTTHQSNHGRRGR